MKLRRLIPVLLLTAALLLTACGKASSEWQEQYELGVKYLSEGNYQEAILAFTAAIEIDPNLPDAYVGRADAYIGSAEQLSAQDNASDAAVREQILRCYECAEADYRTAVELAEDGNDMTEDPDEVRRRMEDAAAKQMEIPPEDQIPAYDPETMEEEPAPEEPVEEAPAEPEVDPAEVQAALTLYAQLLADTLTPLSWSNEYYEMGSSPVMGTEPASFEGAWGNPYGVSAMLLADLNDDGIPELILQAGEVEQQLFLFTVRDGQVHCTGFGWLDNQNGTCVLSLYQNAEGRTVAVSDGGAGTGAGNAYFIYYTNPEDLSMQETSFRAYDDFDGTSYVKVYRNGDQEITEDEYNQLRSAFYTSMTPVAILEFVPLGTDAVGTLNAEAAAWTAQ